MVKRIDIYLGELSISHYYTITEYLRRTIPKYGGRVCSTKNHSKVMVGYGDKFDFVIESSANVNRNPRYEQTSICVDSDVADFYKGFFDKLSSPHEDYGDWEAWNGRS